MQAQEEDAWITPSDVAKLAGTNGGKSVDASCAIVQVGRDLFDAHNDDLRNHMLSTNWLWRACRPGVPDRIDTVNTVLDAAHEFSDTPCVLGCQIRSILYTLSLTQPT